MKRVALAILCLGPWLTACSDESRERDAGSTSTSGAGGSTGSSSTGTAGSTSGVGGSQPELTRATIDGDVTWTVTFDETAKTNGATDCAYTRHYTGVEDESAKWLCPACEVIFRADVQVTAGLQDCYAQVSDNPPAPVEWIGYGNGIYYRGVGITMSEQGTATLAEPDLTAENQVMDLEAPVGGLLAFDVAGQFTLGEQDGDPMHGFQVPSSYACGWPKADPPPYTGDYTIANGQTLPDGLFKDSCGETVRLHDFAGDYLLIDMAALDCPPCQSMASQEEPFVSAMAAQNITVHVITLMAPSLGNPLGETTGAMLDNWSNTYSLTSPVLADRGWGLSMFLPLFADETGYPSWVLVDPNLKVFDAGTGFGDFQAFQNAILAHQP
jgi:hypothetical protein